MIILLVGKSRTPATSGIVAAIRAHGHHRPTVVRQWRRGPCITHNRTSASGTGRRRSPGAGGGARRN